MAYSCRKSSECSSCLGLTFNAGEQGNAEVAGGGRLAFLLGANDGGANFGGYVLKLELGLLGGIAGGAYVNTEGTIHQGAGFIKK